MNCKEAIEVLGLRELESDPALPTDLRGHLKVCKDCDIHYAMLLGEHRAYTVYNATLTPSRDLWHQIETKIQPKPSRLSWLRLPEFLPVPVFAATVLAAFGLAGSLMWFRSDRSPDAIQVAVTEQEHSSVVEPDAPPPDSKLSQTATVKWPVKLPSVYRSTTASDRRSPPKTGRATPVLNKTEAVLLDMEDKYTAAIVSLSRELARQRRSLSRSAISQFEQDLPQVDAEIQSSRRAARDQGYEPAAILSMNEAYERKIDLLRNIVGK